MKQKSWKIIKKTQSDQPTRCAASLGWSKYTTIDKNDPQKFENYVRKIPIVFSGLGGMNGSSVSLGAPGKGWKRINIDRLTHRQMERLKRKEGMKKIGNKLHYY